MLIRKSKRKYAVHKALSILAAAFMISAAAGVTSAAAVDSSDNSVPGVIIAPGVNVSSQPDDTDASENSVIIAPGVTVPSGSLANGETGSNAAVSQVPMDTSVASDSTGPSEASQEPANTADASGSTGLGTAVSGIIIAPGAETAGTTGPGEGAANADSANNTVSGTNDGTAADVYGSTDGNADSGTAGDTSSNDSSADGSTDSDETEQNPYHIDPAKPMIALTFDDGPRTLVTSRILDSLKQNGGRATFFMVGSRVNANADVIRRMVEQGCELGNHTHDHKYISKLSQEQIISQVGTTNQLIANICGVTPVVMRPPGGYINASSLSVIGSMGMSAIMWSVDTRDWEHRDSAKTINHVLSNVKDGDIILMHDIYDATGDAAVTLIPELTSRGYQLVTISELASYRGGLTAGNKYSKFR